VEKRHYMAKYIQKNVNMPIMASIHINTIIYVISEHKKSRKKMCLDQL